MTLAHRRLMRHFRIHAPIVTAALVALTSIMIVWWGPPTPGSLRTTRLSDVRGELADAGCEFTADVHLGSAWQQWTFSAVRDEVRKAFIANLRYKRRYMVETAVEREGLAAELTGVINRLARAEIAERVEFARFEFF